MSQNKKYWRLGLLACLFVAGAFSYNNCSGSGFNVQNLNNTSSLSASAITSPNPMGITAAARLLNQGTYGATAANVQAVSQMSYAQWFNQQNSASVSLELPYFYSSQIQAGFPAPGFSGIPGFSRYQIWLYNVINGQDQLRQRMAFALSQIFVVSDMGPDAFNNGIPAMAGYMDMLANDALGNFRQLLNDVTLNPTMGMYLSMMGNGGTNLPAGVHADENFAREVMQLFTVGLNTLNPDGTEQLNGSGQPIPTYTQAQVEDLAKTLTGWGSFGSQWQGANFGAAQLLDPNTHQVMPMIPYASEHDTTSKSIIGNTTIPAGQTAAQDLKLALDTLFNHPNVGPFFGKQLIQKLVTSNPSPAYVNRVAQVFNNDGTGVRGNLLAVAQAVLTDPEAINGSQTNTQFGRMREPLLKLTHFYRAFNASTPYLYSTAWNNDFANSPFLYWPLDALTVFNFFQPQYQPAGLIAQAGLLAPEFEVMTDNSIVSVSNNVNYYTSFYKGTAVTGVQVPWGSYDGITPVLDLSSWEAVAASPANLVAQFNNVFMNGTMPAAMSSALISYASSVSNIDKRIADLIDLVVNSPQYSIQR